LFDGKNEQAPTSNTPTGAQQDAACPYPVDPTVHSAVAITREAQIDAGQEDEAQGSDAGLEILRKTQFTQGDGHVASNVLAPHRFIGSMEAAARPLIVSIASTPSREVEH
jgi:hypothetical protein